MDATMLLDGMREMLRMGILLAAPALAAALVVGLVIGLGQTMTQLHEPTVALIPRLLAVGLVLFLVLPWMVSQWVSYAATLWQSMPSWVLSG
jgi:flagellar biosynthesis protein FliQ